MGIDYSKSYNQGTRVTAYQPQKRDANPLGRLDSGWQNISSGIIEDRDEAQRIAKAYKTQHPTSVVRIKKTERIRY